MRLAATLLLILPALVLGRPLCCVAGTSCCERTTEPSETGQVEQAEAACPCCRKKERPAPKPERKAPEPSQPKTCNCSNHPVDLVHHEGAPSPAPDLVMVAMAPAPVAFAVTDTVAPLTTAAPPGPPAPLTLPLLL